MVTKITRQADKQRTAALAFLEMTMREVKPAEFAVKLWDGTAWSPCPGRIPRFTLALNHPGTLRSMFLPLNQVTLGEAYIYGDYDVEGNLEDAFAVGEALLRRKMPVAEKWHAAALLLQLPAMDRKRRESGALLQGQTHSRQRDRSAISYHYDVSNEFYSLWLDRFMVYSCAYFTSPDDNLDAAQERKLDYICRKLRLKKGEKLLDIGCGWGGLIIHAASKYGVEALGVTLSEEQAKLASERIAREGLSARCRVEVRDYRDIEGTFDKVVSVGMFEHVGKVRLREYFQRAWHLLRPRGIFLNHGIAESRTTPPMRGPSFIDRYVFPDGELLPVSEALLTAEASGFEVRDVESLREHYALTLQHWVKRLEGAMVEARKWTDEMTCRIWRLYMAGSAHGFRSGRLNLYQTLLVKPENGASDFPMTRSWMYAADGCRTEPDAG